MKIDASFLFFFLFALAVLGLWSLHLAFWSRRLSIALSYAAEETLTMPDGGVITLRHLGTPAGSSEPPVLLVHGIAVNHRNNDCFPEHSFARFLHERGRDVWLLTLRSGHTSMLPVKRQRKAFKAMRDHDLPRAIEAVLARTGAKQLDISCYSMGGMVLYAALGRTVEPSLLRRVLVFASPGMVRPLGFLRHARHLPRALTPAVPMRLFMRSIAFAHAVLPEAPLSVFYNPRNVPPRFARACMMDLFEDIPGALGADFVRWSADQGRVCVDGKPILEGLEQVDVPVCFFAGTGDWLAPPPLVRAAYDAWGARVPGLERHFVLRGRGLGAREEYGHGDFAFGTHAREEVFEPAFAFLEGRAAQDPSVLGARVVFDEREESRVVSVVPAEPERRDQPQHVGTDAFQREARSV